MEATLNEIKFLADSSNRAEALLTLRERSLDRDELQVTTGASAPTVGRIVGNFEERGWITREGARYELTKPGRFVADHFTDFVDGMDTERRLREVWEWLPGELSDFTPKLVADAVVTAVEPGDPYGPANHCTSLY